MTVYIKSTCLACALSLCACATPPAVPLPPPEPVVTIKQVNIPVPVPCVTAVPAAPVLEATPDALAALTPDFNGAWNGIALLKGDIAILSADDAKLRATLQGCVGAKP